jgi:hypothetical protein
MEELMTPLFEADIEGYLSSLRSAQRSSKRRASLTDLKVIKKVKRSRQSFPATKFDILHDMDDKLFGTSFSLHLNQEEMNLNTHNQEEVADSENEDQGMSRPALSSDTVNADSDELIAEDATKTAVIDCRDEAENKSVHANEELFLADEIESTLELEQNKLEAEAEVQDGDGLDNLAITDDTFVEIANDNTDMIPDENLQWTNATTLRPQTPKRKRSDSATPQTPPSRRPRTEKDNLSRTPIDHTESQTNTQANTPNVAFSKTPLRTPLFENQESDKPQTASMTSTNPPRTPTRQDGELQAPSTKSSLGSKTMNDKTPSVQISPIRRPLQGKNSQTPSNHHTTPIKGTSFSAQQNSAVVSNRHSPIPNSASAGSPASKRSSKQTAAAASMTPVTLKTSSINTPATRNFQTPTASSLLKTKTPIPASPTAKAVPAIQTSGRGTPLVLPTEKRSRTPSNLLAPLDKPQSLQSPDVPDMATIVDVSKPKGATPLKAKASPVPVKAKSPAKSPFKSKKESFLDEDVEFEIKPVTTKFAPRPKKPSKKQPQIIDVPKPPTVETVVSTKTAVRTLKGVDTAPVVPSTKASKAGLQGMLLFNLFRTALRSQNFHLNSAFYLMQVF